MRNAVNARKRRDSPVATGRDDDPWDLRTRAAWHPVRLLDGRRVAHQMVAIRPAQADCVRHPPRLLGSVHDGPVMTDRTGARALRGKTKMGQHSRHGLQLAQAAWASRGGCLAKGDGVGQSFR